MELNFQGSCIVVDYVYIYMYISNYKWGSDWWLDLMTTYRS
jgi:hypothetical protein